MNEPAESSEFVFDDDPDRSRVTAWWLGLDGGWRATLVGLVVVAGSFVVGSF